MTLSEVQDAIVGRIASTPTTRKVTWDDVMKMTLELEVPCTRQWLSANKAIAAAYRNHRDLRRSGDAGPAEGSGPDSLVDLKRKVAELTVSLRTYDERFMRYLYNAQRAGLTVADLDRPVPARRPPSERQKGTDASA